jgi:hypothetical protein
MYETGFDNHPDKGLLLPIEGSIAGSAYSSGTALYETKGPNGRFASAYDLGAVEYRGLLRFVWAELTWVLAVPIETLRGDRFVVILDGDKPLQDTPSSKDLLEALAEFIGNSYVTAIFATDERLDR